jgi:hypothetical protein
MPSIYQALFPVTTYLYAASYNSGNFPKFGIESVFMLPMGENHHSTLTNWATSYEEGSYSSALDYLSEIVSDASRAAEFMVTESNFTDLALFWAKRILGAYVLLPPNTIDNS